MLHRKTGSTDKLRHVLSEKDIFLCLESEPKKQLVCYDVTVLINFAERIVSRVELAVPGLSNDVCYSIILTNILEDRFRDSGTVHILPFMPSVLCRACFPTLRNSKFLW